MYFWLADPPKLPDCHLLDYFCSPLTSPFHIILSRGSPFCLFDLATLAVGHTLFQLKRQGDAGGSCFFPISFAQLPSHLSLSHFLASFLFRCSR